MDVSEKLFGVGYKVVSRIWRRARQQEVEARAATLVSLRGRLLLLARLLTGAPIEIETAESEGGWRGLVFYLPASCAGLSSPAANAQFYVFRICYLAVQRSLDLNWPNAASHALMESRREAATAAPYIVAKMRRRYPGIAPILDALVAAHIQASKGSGRGVEDAHFLWGKWMSPIGTVAAAGSAAEAPQKAADHASPVTEFKSPPKETVTLVEVNRRAIEEYTLSHSFEKVETIEDFSGLWRDLDGADNLEQDFDALGEADLRHVTRVDDPAHSVYQMNLREPGGGLQVEERETQASFVAYDEWDFRERNYRPAYCRVYPQPSPAPDHAYARAVLAKNAAALREIEKRVLTLRTRLEEVRRRPYGDDPDLDAMIEAIAARRAGRPASENIYVQRRRRQPDTAILILMDLSLSTDAYTGGERVLDVERQSVLLFGEALDRVGVRFQVDGFSSRTRNNCHYVGIKSFAESWSHGKAHFGALSPSGYTRIGPAIRHAQMLLRRESAAHRWILLISDAKPTDYDQYEGQYGIRDIRQAIRESQRVGIDVFGLAVDATARDYLPQMLAPGRYRILPRVAALPSALAEFFERLVT